MGSRTLVASVLAVLLLHGCGGEKRTTHDDILGTPAVDAAADALQSTEVTAYLDYPHASGKNILWCTTMQIAWNELGTLLGEEVATLENPKIVLELNRSIGNAADLDDGSYVAVAGITPMILSRIDSLLNARFRGSASPELLGELMNLPPKSVVSYSYLFKNLEFAVHFQRQRHPLRFAGAQVEAFGLPKHRTRRETLIRAAEQVRIYDYRGQDNFIVELESASMGDRILLAKISPESTLAATVDSVALRLAASEPLNMEDDVPLAVPMLNFRVLRDYPELVEQTITCRNPQYDGYEIVRARQLIRFRLDETGAKLKSEAEALSKILPLLEEQPVTLIFDKPFLILLERRDAEHPYFALWVDNPELLVPYREPEL